MPYSSRAVLFYGEERRRWRNGCYVEPSRRNQRAKAQRDRGDKALKYYEKPSMIETAKRSSSLSLSQCARSNLLERLKSFLVSGIRSAHTSVAPVQLPHNVEAVNDNFGIWQKSFSYIAKSFIHTIATAFTSARLGKPLRYSCTVLMFLLGRISNALRAKGAVRMHWNFSPPVPNSFKV